MRKVCMAVAALAVACLVAFGSTSVAQAAKGNKGNKVKKTPEEIFKAKDKDGDGKLTLDEFKGKSKKPERAEKAEKIFKAKDKDGDGTLTLEEFKAATGKHGKKGAKKQKNG